MKTLLKIVAITLIFQACGEPSQSVVDERVRDVSGLYLITEGHRRNWNTYDPVFRESDVTGLYASVTQNGDVASVLDWCFGPLQKRDSSMFLNCDGMSGYGTLFRIWSGYGRVFFKSDNTMQYTVILNAFYPKTLTSVYSELVFEAKLDTDTMDWIEEIIPK